MVGTRLCFLHSPRSRPGRGAHLRPHQWPSGHPQPWRARWGNGVSPCAREARLATQSLPCFVEAVYQSGRDRKVQLTPMVPVVQRDAAMSRVTLSEEELDALQWTTLQYYIRE